MNKDNLTATNDAYILWSREEVKAFLGFKSDTAIYNAIKSNGFPKPLRIGGQASRWRKSEVLAYIDNCAQELDHKRRA